MLDFQDRRRWRRWLYSRPTIALLALTLVWLGHSVWRVYWRSRAVAAERQRTAAELAALKERQRVLTIEIAKLKTDEGIETEIRKKFPVVRDGERVIVVVPEEPIAAIATTTKNWRQWLANLIGL